MTWVVLGEGLATASGNNRTDFFTVGQAQDIGRVSDRKNGDRNVVVAAKGRGCSVHDAQVQAAGPRHG